jgi:hypothetical protein
MSGFNSCITVNDKRFVNNQNVVDIEQHKTSMTESLMGENEWVSRVNSRQPRLSMLRK